jgi:hypothetical protein
MRHSKLASYFALFLWLLCVFWIGDLFSACLGIVLAYVTGALVGRYGEKR